MRNPWWTPSYIPFDEADKIVEDYEKGLRFHGIDPRSEDFQRTYQSNPEEPRENPLLLLLKVVDAWRSRQHMAEALIRSPTERCQWPKFHHLSQNEIVRIVVTQREQMGLPPYPAANDKKGMLRYNALLDEWVISHPNTPYGIDVLLACERQKEQQVRSQLPWTVRFKEWLTEAGVHFLVGTLGILVWIIYFPFYLLQLIRGSKDEVISDDFGSYFKWCKTRKYKFHKYLR